MRKYKLEIDAHQAETLRLAVRETLRFLGFYMIDETPQAFDSDSGVKSWYSETSHIDNLVRLYVRLNRIILGHKQFNAVIPYTRRPKS